jgi:hypothetical protein
VNSKLAEKLDAVIESLVNLVYYVQVAAPSTPLTVALKIWPAIRGAIFANVNS